MNNVLTKLKQLINKVTGYFPTATPRGMKEFDKWSDSIISTYNLPSNDSSKFALATMLLHLDQTQAYVPKRFFGLCALKGATSQVAHGVMMDLKDKQKARAKAEEDEAAKTSQQAEVTANKVQASTNVLSISNS